jgi:hypothetical protein
MHMTRSKIGRASATLTLLATAGAAGAQVHAGDIILRIENGAIRTGSLADPTIRVFTTTLGEAAPDFASDPGFDCMPGTFPTGTRNGLRIRRVLRVWDGEDFDMIAPSLMNISFATLSFDSPPEDRVVTGFTLSVGSNGQWHRHVDYTLLAPATPGVHLLDLEVFSTSAAIAASDPFWILFNQGRTSEEVQAAAAWVVANLVSPTPCPADFNQDGGVDGGDVESFFISWEAGASSADVNADGGVDGSDVESFFTAWQAGGC